MDFHKWSSCWSIFNPLSQICNGKERISIGMQTSDPIFKDRLGIWVLKIIKQKQNDHKPNLKYTGVNKHVDRLATRMGFFSFQVYEWIINLALQFNNCWQFISYDISPMTETKLFSEWLIDCIITPKLAISRLYHGKNKLHSMKW